MTDEQNPSQDFGSYIQKNMRTLAECIKTSSMLPVGSARNNFNTCFPSFTSKMKPHSDQVLNIISKLLTKEGIKQNVEHCDNDEKIDLVVDGVNKIVDRVRDNLNILNGTKSIPVMTEIPIPKENINIGSWNKDKKHSRVWKANLENVKKPLHIQKVLEKPQLHFEEKIDNTNTPFKPCLQSKPNAIKPLTIYLERDMDGNDHYCHPYMHELNSFEVPQLQLQNAEPIEPAKIDSDVCYIDNEESLANLVDELKNEKELAIDLEYHNYRSFHGFTCLLQISTRSKDYIIDTIALRSKLEVLNKYFTDPKIVKVLHGATSDVIWLQKDLNLYLVNMFDTHLASMVLDFQRLSLAFLLKHYCNVVADKRYQLYDWRIRPLPEAALMYARGDTHYLLYIYDQLRNALIDKAHDSDNLLQSVYSRGLELCKKRYQKTFDVNGHLTLYKQSKQSFDGRQMHALKLLYRWRDKIARREDESTAYVLPNHMLMQIAEILPREMQGILACCNPVPSLVRQNLFEMHQLIAEARCQPLNKMSNRQDTESMTANKGPSLSKLRCPHDFSYHDDFRDNLTTLLGGTDVIKVDDEQPEIQLSVFDENENVAVCSKLQNREAKLKSLTFVSPYERYKRTVKYVLAQVEKKNQENTKTESPVEQVPEELEENVHIFRSRPRKDEIKKNTINEGSSALKDVKTETTRELCVDKIVPPAAVITVGTKRKQSILDDEGPNKKFATDCDSVAETTATPPDSVNEEVTTEVQSTPAKTTRKANKRKNKKQKNSDCTKAQTATGSSFKPFDYAKTNYDKFVSAGQKNLKALLNAKITFGSKKTNRNKTKINHNKFKKGKKR